MSESQPTTSQPRLVLTLLILAIALAGSLVFASVFETVPNPAVDPTLCGNPAPLVPGASAKSHDHKKSDEPKRYYVGGIVSAGGHVAAQLESAILAAGKGERIACQTTAISETGALVVIDRSPILPASKRAATEEASKPRLVLSIDYAGGISSMEYPAAAELQKYITSIKDDYRSILIVEPLPGPVRDPDEDWTYLNFSGDSHIDFLTPQRGADAEAVVQSIYEALDGPPLSGSPDPQGLIEQLSADDSAAVAEARWRLTQLSPYEVVPKLERWLDDAEDAKRGDRLFEVLMLKRAMGVHADAAIAEAAASDDEALRAQSARAIGDLAEATTAPIALLTPLAEDDSMMVRYEALVATRAMAGRVAAGVAQLVEPYEMNDAMRSLYRETMFEMLAFGEPVPADSRANRLRRMPIDELLAQDRDALTCVILLERTDLPDAQVNAVLEQLAAANANDPLVTLLNLLEAMNPRTLAEREVLLRQLVAWNTRELNAQATRLQEIASGAGPDRLRSAAAASLLQADGNAAVQLLGIRPILFEALAWDATPRLATFLAPVILQTALSDTKARAEARVAALDVFDKVPADQFTPERLASLKSLARQAPSLEVRFAAIRALNRLPDGVVVTDVDDLVLETVDIAAVPGQMRYDKATLTVTAGRPVELTLTNPDTMEHNLVITLPGRAQEIGVAMSADPTAAAATNYVPEDSPAVLHHTRMIEAGGSDTLRFIAPQQPGRYEYVCTYPGHYTSMIGVLEVVAP
jgi:azurin